MAGVGFAGLFLVGGAIFAVAVIFFITRGNKSRD